VSGGKASVSTAALLEGTHVITATYSGDSNANAGTAAPLMQTVGAAANPEFDVYLPIIQR
jgi:hypothetical protein